MAEVILRNVEKIYENGFHAVHDADIEIKDKEFVVLVGPSGCGKSTTLRMIAGLEDITDGEILIEDKVVNNILPKDRDIAMVFQNYALYPHMTVYDNMAFGLKLRKYHKDEIKKRVNEAAEILGIESLLDRKPKQLSGGQRQRVAVGRAIVRHPKVFLFDEPLSNLDAKLRVQMRSEISKLHTKLQTTMIYVTHDQVEAMTMGDKIVVMKDGYIQQIDKPLTLYTNPVNKFVAGFIGSPAMNFVEGTVTEDMKFKSSLLNFDIPKKIHKKLEEQKGKKIYLGVRPEHIYHKNTKTVLNEFSEFKTKVEVIEPMGNEIFTYLANPDSKEFIVSRLEPHIEPKVEQNIELKIDLEHIHFFDHETEKALLYE